MAMQRDVNPPPAAAAARVLCRACAAAARGAECRTEPTRLAVRIGEDRYLLDMAVAGEIVSLPAGCAVPWTKPWYRGLANVRGRLVGVVDLPQLPAARRSRPSRRSSCWSSDGRSTSTPACWSRAPSDCAISRTCEPSTAPGDAGRVARQAFRDRRLVLTELDLRELVASPALYCDRPASSRDRGGQTCGSVALDMGLKKQSGGGRDRRRSCHRNGALFLPSRASASGVEPSAARRRHRAARPAPQDRHIDRCRREGAHHELADRLSACAARSSAKAGPAAGAGAADHDVGGLPVRRAAGRADPRNRLAANGASD